MYISREDYLKIIFDCTIRLNNVRINNPIDFVEYFDIYTTILSIRDNMKEDILKYNKENKNDEANKLIVLYTDVHRRAINMSYKFNRLLSYRFKEFKDVIYGDINE